MHAQLWGSLPNERSISNSAACMHVRHHHSCRLVSQDCSSSLLTEGLGCPAGRYVPWCTHNYRIHCLTDVISCPVLHTCTRGISTSVVSNRCNTMCSRVSREMVSHPIRYLQSCLDSFVDLDSGSFWCIPIFVYARTGNY